MELVDIVGVVGVLTAHLPDEDEPKQCLSAHLGIRT